MESPTPTAPIHVVPAPPRPWYSQLPPSGRRPLTSDAAVLDMAGVSLTLHVDADRLRGGQPGTVIITDERFPADVELMAPYPGTTAGERLSRVILAAADDGFAGDIELTCTPWRWNPSICAGHADGPGWMIIAATYTDAEGVRYS